jgi:hypothetical protein
VAVVTDVAVNADADFADVVAVVVVDDDAVVDMAASRWTKLIEMISKL